MTIESDSEEGCGVSKFFNDDGVEGKKCKFVNLSPDQQIIHDNIELGCQRTINEIENVNKLMINNGGEIDLLPIIER